jgi:competence protein ComEC
MLFRNTPFLRIGLPFSAGIVWADALPDSGFVPYTPLALCVLWLLLESLVPRRYAFRYAWCFGLVQQLCFFLLGIAIVQLHDERHHADFFPKIIALENGPVEVMGTLTDVPTVGSKLKVPIRISHIACDSQWVPASGQVMCMLDPDSTLEHTLNYGTQLRFKARIGPVKPALNPHTFDYGYYLHHQNIHHQAFIKAKDVQILGQNKGYFALQIAYQWRSRLLSVLKKHFPTRDEYAVASALLVGYKADLSDELKTAYAETGSMHALAVSGTHVGLLYAGIFFLLNLIPLYSRRTRLVQYGLVLLVIWAFTLLTGASASVLRAAVMFSLFLFGQIILRPTNTWNVLFASIFLLLLFNPYLLFDAGFQLSYAAVGGIVFFYPRIWKVLPTTPYRLVDEALKVLAVGTAAQLGTLPLSLYYFHQFPCYFWLAGWVVVLGGAIFMGAGAALVVLDSLWAWGAHWLGVILYWKIWFINRTIGWIQGLPGSVWPGIWIETTATALLYGTMLLLAAAMVRRNTRWLIAAQLSLFLVFGIQVWEYTKAVSKAEFRIYHVPKGSLADFSYGGQTLSWGEKNLSAKQINMAAQGHRWALHTHELNAMNFERDTVWAQGAYKNPVLQVHNFRIAIINTTEDLLHPPLSVDAIWLCNNADVDIRACNTTFPCQQVIADGSSDWKHRRRWKAEAVEAGFLWHDTGEQGSWCWNK